MSRKRSRNVTGKWPSQPQLLKHVHDGEKLFGSKILSNFPSPEYDSFQNFETNDLIRQVYLDGSSSSSLSGYEDFETEATRKVENELVQMNKVLQKEVPIPDHYDKEEYLQWMQMFPNVSVWDKRSKESIETVLPNDSNNYLFKLQGNHLDGFDFRNKNDSGESQNSLKFFEDVHRVNRKKKTYPKATHQQRDNNSKQLFDKVRFRSDLEKVRALSRSEVLSSRWMKNSDNNNQQHLPQICSASVLSTRIPVEKTVEKKVESGHSLILPPIKNNRESRALPNDIFPIANGIRSTKKRYSSTLNNNSQYKSVRIRDARRKSDNSWL